MIELISEKCLGDLEKWAAEIQIQTAVAEVMSEEREQRGAVDVLCIFFFIFFLFFFGELECAGHSYAYVAHVLFLRDVWIRTQKATIASRRANSLATHPPS